MKISRPGIIEHGKFTLDGIYIFSRFSVPSDRLVDPQRFAKVLTCPVCFFFGAKIIMSCLVLFAESVRMLCFNILYNQVRRQTVVQLKADTAYNRRYLK